MTVYSRCAIHETDESYGDEPYMVCFECGHLYPTAEDLVKAYEEMIEELKKRDNEGGHFMPKYEAAQIFFCPHCLHDF